MFFMLQKEMGERLAAEVGTKAYGALSVRTQLRYEVAVEKIVPPQVFCPPPEVDSALVSFKLREERKLSAEHEKIFTTVVRELFNQRRKQIGKLLGQMTGSKDTAAKILDECGFAPDLRPDKLTVADFVKLTEELTSFKG